MGTTSSDIWEVMSTARTIRRFTDEPVDMTSQMSLLAAGIAPSSSVVTACGCVRPA